MAYRIQYYLVMALAKLVSILPFEGCLWVASRFADLFFLILPGRRKVAIDNIKKAFGTEIPEKQVLALARAAFQNAAISFAELMYVDKVTKGAQQRFELKGNEHLEEVFSRGKGAILVISHLGSWEFLAFLPFLTKQNWSVIVKEVRNPFLNHEIDNARRKMTLVPIVKNNSIRTVLKELRANHGVAILIDQWDGRDGTWGNFFGHPTTTTTVPARLAMKTEAALVPAYCIRKAKGLYEIQIHPPVNVDLKAADAETAITEKLNALLEEQIRRYPQQWLWGHRRWKGQPPVKAAETTSGVDRNKVVQ